MPRKKKPFINKKTDNIRTYSLIPKTDSAAEDPEARKKLQGNYGIEFDDDYNYLQHMRNVGEISDGATIIRYGKTAAENLLEMVHCGKASALVLSPEEVEIEEDKEESDPEIKEVLAALDDDEAIDEDLSEDLIDQLNAPPEDSDEHKLPKASKISSKSGDEDFNWDDDSEDMEEEEDEEEDDEDDDNDTNADGKGSHLSNDDARSNNSDVTDTSLSTVTRRVGQLGILDEGFEKYLERKAMELDDEDSDDFEENAEYDSKILQKIQEEKEAEKKDTVLMKDFVEKPVDREQILNRYAYDSSEEEMEEHVEEVDPMAGWDCESFIHSMTSPACRAFRDGFSYYLGHPSTKKFAPTVIEILPAKPKKVKGLSQESENGLEPTSSMQKSSIRSLRKAALEHEKPVAIPRNKNETEEEKKERKQKVKEQRKERREVKSQNKTLWQQARYRNQLELVRTDQAHLGTRTE